MKIPRGDSCWHCWWYVFMGGLRGGGWGPAFTPWLSEAHVGCSSSPQARKRVGRKGFEVTTVDTSGNVVRVEPTAAPACGQLGSDTGANGTVRCLGSSSATRPPEGAADRRHVALASVDGSVFRLVQAACCEPTETHQ